MTLPARSYRPLANRAAFRDWSGLAAWLLVSIALHGVLGLAGSAPREAPPAPRSLAVALMELPAPSPQPQTQTQSPAPAAPPARTPAKRQAPPPARPPHPEPIPAVVAEPDAACTVVAEPEAELPSERHQVAAAFASRLTSSQISIGAMAGGQSRAPSAAEGEAGGGDDGGLRKATPRYETNPPPEYPRLARRNHWEGVVKLRALVTPGGTIERLAIERSSGHAVLDRSAIDGVRQWRFVPATRNGVPVACEVRIPVAFRLDPEP